MLEDLCEAAVSVNFNHSDNSDSSELWSPPLSHSFMVKCFNCHGTSLIRCQHCHSTGFVSSQHPMAQMLAQVLQAKMAPLEESVPVIREEEEETEERRRKCEGCGAECEEEEVNWWD